MLFTYCSRIQDYAHKKVDFYFNKFIVIGSTTKYNMTVSSVMRSTKVPPDGGWGWMIVIAFAICNVSIQLYIYIYI